jgi:hypothetical protein
LRYPGNPKLNANVDVSLTKTRSDTHIHPFETHRSILDSSTLTSAVLIASYFTQQHLQENPFVYQLVMLTFFGWTFSSIGMITCLREFYRLVINPVYQTNDLYVMTLHSYSERYAVGDGEGDGSNDKPTPHRFVENCTKDPPGTADVKWAKTIEWRKAEKIDSVLLEKQPYFADIKTCYPHFYARTDLSDTRICYYERPGYLELPRLKEIGLQSMVRHKLFLVEFCWTYVGLGENITTLSAVDISNVGLFDLKGVVKEYLGAISKIAQDHYPERASKICVLNAPGWFSQMWNIIKLGLQERVQKKVFILSAAQCRSTLKTLIAEENIPFEYGGDLKFDTAPGKSITTNADFPGPLGKEQEAVRWCSEYEVATADYVRRVNAREKLPMPPSKAWEREDWLAEKEEYLASYEPGWLEHESQMHLPVDQWEKDKWPGMLFAAK